ncbi:MAG TPA: N-acetylmuramoyl-L-alanine amidase, partial [Gemmatimonadetes bacterium]|nr:N-acetylmuramoyl-L-alanine amidase [Gemmatimonadota bacterium]
HGLSADGMCGPSTYRRINTDRQQMGDFKKYQLKSSSEFIYYRGKPMSIQWDKVSTHLDPEGLDLVGGRSSYSGKKRDIKFFVNHWDVCLSSDSCVKVLNRRNISVHFCIDNDGTIHQLMDLNDAAWHAGGYSWNHSSIGVEIANAYYPKYQDWYEKHGFGKRPLVEDQEIHGKSMKPFMDFYPVQKEALKALWVACHEGLGIPLEAPETKWAVDPTCKSNKFRGFCSHYHLTRGKIDCAGLDIDKMLEEIKINPRYCPDK